LETEFCFLLRLLWTTILLYILRHIWDDRHAPLRWALTNFFLLPGLAWNCDPPHLSLLSSLGWQACTSMPTIGWHELPAQASLNFNPPNLSLPSS
jgi:hypothetical protein